MSIRNSAIRNTDLLKQRKQLESELSSLKAQLRELSKVFGQESASDRPEYMHALQMVCETLSNLGKE